MEKTKIINIPRPWNQRRVESQRKLGQGHPTIRFSPIVWLFINVAVIIYDPPPFFSLSFLSCSVLTVTAGLWCSKYQIAYMYVKKTTTISIPVAITVDCFSSWRISLEVWSDDEVRCIPNVFMFRSTKMAGNDPSKYRICWQ